MPTLADVRTPTLLSNDKTIGTATKTELLGKLSVAETLLDPAADVISLKWDITDHLDGHAGSMTADIEISTDDRKTWRHLAGAARDKGYAPIEEPGEPNDIAYLRVALPEVGNPNRWVRGSLVVDGQAVRTNFEIVPIETAKL